MPSDGVTFSQCGGLYELCILCSHFSVRDIPNDPCVEGWVVRTLGVVGGKKFASLVVLAAASAMSSDRCVPPGETKKGNCLQCRGFTSARVSRSLPYSCCSRRAPRFSQSPFRTYCFSRVVPPASFAPLVRLVLMRVVALVGASLYVVPSYRLPLTYFPRINCCRYQLHSRGGAHTQSGVRASLSLDTASRCRVRPSSLLSVNHPRSRS